MSIATDEFTLRRALRVLQGKSRTTPDREILPVYELEIRADRIPTLTEEVEIELTPQLTIAQKLRRCDPFKVSFGITCIMEEMK